MASSFAIHARQNRTTQSVLLGRRLRLAGCRDAANPGGEPLHSYQDAPYDVAHELMAHPCCCV